MSVELLAIGVIRSGTDVLLVRQGSPAGPGTVWALPGGRVGPIELAVEALAREIREEPVCSSTVCRGWSASARWSTPPPFSATPVRFQHQVDRR